MVEKMDCAVDAALMAFAKAREPGIYKEDYINELLSRYGDDDESFPTPELPDWCFEEEEEDDDYNEDVVSHTNQSVNLKRPGSSIDPAREGSSSSHNSKPPSAKRQKRNEFINLNATFMSGVPGVTLVTDTVRLKSLQECVQSMCEWENRGFPGCQPVSMDRNNLNFLHTKPYRVSWKADGTRYMMLILKENEIYFFDRDNSCFQVQNMKFVHREDLSKHLCDTLLDGVSIIFYNKI